MKVEENMNLGVEAIYDFDGKKKYYLGDVTYISSEKKLVGIMTDRENAEKSKLILGLMIKDSLRYIDINPLEIDHYPFFANLRGNLQRGYVGDYGVLLNLMDYDFYNRLKPEIIKTYSLLSNREKLFELGKIEARKIDILNNLRLMDEVSYFGKKRHFHTELKFINK